MTSFVYLLEWPTIERQWAKVSTRETYQCSDHAAWWPWEQILQRAHALIIWSSRRDIPIKEKLSYQEPVFCRRIILKWYHYREKCFPLRKFLCKGTNFSFYLLSRFRSRYIKNETIHWKPNKCLIYDVITISRHSEDHYILLNDDLSNIILAKI